MYNLTFESVVKKYQPQITGIIHVGAHYGYEIQSYMDYNVPKVIFFEPLKENFKMLKSVIYGYPSDRITIHNVALGNYNGIVPMNISDNEAQSSSVLKPLVHLKAHPEVSFIGTEEVQMEKLDDYNYDYNFLVIDVQGFELEVLRGASETLKNVDYIYCEVNQDEVYEHNAYIGEIDSFLEQYEFKRVETEWWSTQVWGNALYIKEKKKVENKILKNFPPVYYISLEESVDRRNKIEGEFKQHGITDYTSLISKRFAECEDEVLGTFAHNLKDTSKGCTISHLRNIKNWIDNGDTDIALFVEDDLSFETVNYWNFEWDEFVNELPNDWDAIQLLWIRPGIGSVEFRERFQDDWSVTAFLITRDYGKKLIEKYIINDHVFNFDTEYEAPTCESLIYGLGKVYTYPLFIEDVSGQSTFIDSPDYNTQTMINGQGEFHYESHIRMKNWWKSAGKRKNIKQIFSNRSKFSSDFEWLDFTENEFRENQYEKYSKVNPSDIVVDIGASVGSFTYSIIDKSPSVVYCIEPSEKYFTSLVKNTSKFSVNTPIVYVNQPLSNFEKFVKDYSIDKIDFLKINCDGGEYDIFNEENIDWILNNVKNISSKFYLNFPGCRERFTKFRDNYLELFDDYVIFAIDDQGYKTDVSLLVYDPYFFRSYMGNLMIYIRQ